MIYDVQISNQAENDLRSIFEHIAFELQLVPNAGPVQSIQKGTLAQPWLTSDVRRQRYRHTAFKIYKNLIRQNEASILTGRCFLCNYFTC